MELLAKTINAKNLGQFCAFICAVVFLLVLFGLLAKLAGFNAVVWPADPLLKVNVMVALIFGSVALQILNKRKTGRKRELLGNFCGAVTFIIGFVTFAEYIFNQNLGIDEFLLKDTKSFSETLYPGRMSPHTAFCITLLGLALILLDGKKWLNKVSQWLAITCACSSLFGLFGYLFRAEGLYQISSYIKMSLPSAVYLTFLSVGVLVARPHSGIVKILLRKSPSGMFARRMIQAVFIIPPILGWLGMIAEDQHILDMPTAWALVSLLGIIFFMSVVWQSAEVMATSEKALVIRELEFRTLANSIPQLAWTADADGAVTWFNQQWYNYTGMTESQISMVRELPIFKADARAQILESWEKSVREGNQWESTIQIKGADGVYRWFLSRASSIRDENGDVIRWFGSNTDIDAQQVLTDELNEAKLRAEKANQAKTQFLANMSHEIRTPVGAVIGFIDVLKNEEITPEEKQKFLSIAERNSHNLLRLVDDILDLSKIESEKLVLEELPFGLADFLRDLSSAIEVKSNEKGLDFSLQILEGVPIVITTDQLRLRQILSNLVGNAVKFTDKGRISITVSYEDSLLKFQVSDTGIGISPDVQANLFEVFSQGDASYTRKYGGTGLGLALSKRIARALGGDLVLVKTQLDKGSVFEFEIRPQQVGFENSLTELSRGLGSPKPLAQTSLASMKILLVDDSVDNRTLISNYLTRSGAEVETAADGAEGVLKAAKDFYDLILMDIQMPRMDGYEATQKLRDQGYLNPIVALTAHAMREEKEKALTSGFSHFLTKPISRTTLVNLISELRVDQGAIDKNR